MSETTIRNGLTAWEIDEIDRANTSGKQPVMFLHGLWLLSSSWKPWRDLFEGNGYVTIAPGWPDDPATREEAFANPDLFAGKMVQRVTDHYLGAVARLTRRPAAIGHSFGGLLAQKVAAEGASVATVAIDSAPFHGVLPLPASALKSAAPVLANPGNRKKAVALTFEQFQYGWTNSLDEVEARHLYDTYHVPASGAPLFQAALANLNLFGGETRLDLKSPDRGPLLVIAGDKDNTVPMAISEAIHKLQSRNPGLTEITRVPDRGHSLVIDHGWREVADLALDFVSRFAR
ncbi:MAG: alpha/beta hydrolase [Kineosporiaceae bacterium]|jgi:non-heme chloroperoxidase